MDSSSVGFKIPTEGYQDSRHQLQALLAEQGLDSCLMQGHIYKGTEWRLAERGVFDDDWGWKARHYIPFPDTKWRTKVVLVPRSVEARNRWLHARYERVMDMLAADGLTFSSTLARECWKLVCENDQRELGSFSEEGLRIALLNRHLPACAWDRPAPTSHAAADAFSTRRRSDSACRASISRRSSRRAAALRWSHSSLTSASIQCRVPGTSSGESGVSLVIGDTTKES